MRSFGMSAAVLWLLHEAARAPLDPPDEPYLFVLYDDSEREPADTVHPVCAAGRRIQLLGGPAAATVQPGGAHTGIPAAEALAAAEGIEHQPHGSKRTATTTNQPWCTWQLQLLSIGSSSPDETGIPAPSQPRPHSRTSSTSTSTILSIDSMAMHSWRPWAFMPPVDRLGQGSPM